MVNILFPIPVRSIGPVFEVSSTNTDFNVGDNVTMTCVATNPIAGQVVVWERYYPEGINEPEYILELAVNGDMNEPLEMSLQRYSTSVVWTPDLYYVQFILNLTVTGK